MELTVSDVERLMTQFEQSDLREFHLNAAPVVLTLSKNEWQANSEVTNTVATPQQEKTVAQESVAAVSESTTVEVEASNVETIRAELVGTVHLQPSPDAEPFVQVGQKISAGEQVAIVEAMKLMTPVISSVSGTVHQICVANDDVVEYDQVLIEVTPMEG